MPKRIAQPDHEGPTLCRCAELLVVGGVDIVAQHPERGVAPIEQVGDIGE